MKSVVVPVTSRGPARSPVLLPGGHRRVTTAVIHAGRGNSSSDSETDGDSRGARGRYGSRSSGRSRPVSRRARTRRDSTTAGTKRSSPKRDKIKPVKRQEIHPNFGTVILGSPQVVPTVTKPGLRPKQTDISGLRGPLDCLPGGTVLLVLAMTPVAGAEMVILIPE